MQCGVVQVAPTQAPMMVRGRGKPYPARVLSKHCWGQTRRRRPASERPPPRPRATRRLCECVGAAWRLCTRRRARGGPKLCTLALVGSRDRLAVLSTWSRAMRTHAARRYSTSFHVARGGCAGRGRRNGAACPAREFSRALHACRARSATRACAQAPSSAVPLVYRSTSNRGGCCRRCGARACVQNSRSRAIPRVHVCHTRRCGTVPQGARVYIPCPHA